MHSLKIPGYEYLQKRPSRDIERDIYNGESFKHFNTDEFDYKQRDIDWIALNIIHNSVNMIVDLAKVSSVKVDFENKNQTEYFQNLLKNGWNLKLEKAIVDKKVYGDGYLQLAVEDNLQTVQEDFQLNLYNIDPESVYADFDKLNPSRGAKGYTLSFEKEIEDKLKAILLITYKPGAIIYESFIIKHEKAEQIDPLEYFEDFFSTDLNYVKQNLTYIYYTETDYNLITHFNNFTNYGEFYGNSDITNNAISKLQVIERMYNLADYANTNNARPERVFSEGTANILKQSIEEIKKGNNYLDDVIGLPSNLSNTNTSNGKPRVTQIASMIRKTIKDKLLFYSVNNGRGEDKYITNPFKLDDLYELIDRTQKELYSDLYISDIFTNPELATGNLSGTALKRLMTRTIEHVSTLREQIKPQIAQLAYSSLQLAKTSNLPNTDFSDLNNLPEVNFDPITEETVEDIVMRYKTALEIKPLTEVKNEAIAKLTKKSKEEVESMEEDRPVSLRDSLQSRLNA